MTRRNLLLAALAAVVLALLATVTGGPVRAVLGVAAGVVLPVVLLAEPIARRLGLGVEGAVGVAIAGVLAYWSLVSFAFLAMGVGPDRWATFGMDAVLLAGIGAFTVVRRPSLA